MRSLSSPSAVYSYYQRLLPNTPGVYIYKNENAQVIYIGKAKNLKNRIRSYFQSPIHLGAKTSLLVQNIRSIETIKVLSETEALLLESRLIKKFKPPFNISSKDDKAPYYIHISKEAYPRPILNHESQGAIAGPFLNGLIPKRILKQLRRVAPYCLAPRPVRRACFYSHIGLCQPCPGSSDNPVAKAIYRKNISRLRLLLTSRFASVAKKLQKQMLQLSREQKFEEAVIIRDHLQALESLQNRPTEPDEYLENPNLVEDKNLRLIDSLRNLLTEAGMDLPPRLGRIEMYDMAHLRGDSATGSMVVAINGELVHSLYRHFRIKYAQSDSDVDMMWEVLTRRFKNADWPKPDLVVLDGGKPQLSIFKNNYEFLKEIPVISLAKQFETIIIPAEDDFKEITPPDNFPGLHLLQQLRDEAHRFSRRLHHKLRSKKLVS